MRVGLLSLIGLLAFAVACRAQCPYAASSVLRAAYPNTMGPPSSDATATDVRYMTALSSLDFTAVQADITALLTNSQSFWPADFGNYGPLFIRLAWHCSGSYRRSDGRGGCDGGRQRFDPERSWADNTNLDKARKLLAPIKLKYGAALSWGDLIVLAGSTAIKNMGGPFIGFCGGRVDDTDGTDSLLLGPTAEQQAAFPCAVPGACTSPLGPTTIGLIYVNPEGPQGMPYPNGSAPQIRDTFDRMGMNDAETVALIGGGHAFGKVHGACSLPNAQGNPPNIDPINSWAGACTSAGPVQGVGLNTFTSGFEGQWSSTPNMWSNEYFNNLLTKTWSVFIGPGGHNQWHAPPSNLMMLTSDISLSVDPAYYSIALGYKNDVTTLTDMFGKAWYKLVTRDMGPVSRCVGSLTAPVQPFQYPLPTPSASFPDQGSLRTAIRGVMNAMSSLLTPDAYGTSYSYAGVFVALAYNCAATFRRTDYLGGCNGARIRLAPQSTWPQNVAMNSALSVLSPVLTSFLGAGLTNADLIVFAGQVALEDAGAAPMTFCAGRSDALATDTGSAYLSPLVNGSISLGAARAQMVMQGLSSREFVALSGRLRSPQQQVRLGYTGSWYDPTVTTTPVLSNAYYKTLLTNQWQLGYSVAGNAQYQAVGKTLYMMPSDLNLIADAEWLGITQEYAADNTLFLAEFSQAWSRLVNVDRFSGPLANLCTVTKSAGQRSLPTAAAALLAVASAIIAVFHSL